MWTSTDAAPGMGQKSGFTQTFPFIKIVDDEEDEDEEDSHDRIPKAGHFGSVEEDPSGGYICLTTEQ